MRIGIEASRANLHEKTGVEWYAFQVIEHLKKLIPSGYEVVLYAQEALKGPLADMPPHWHERRLAWPLHRGWTSVRLSWEIKRRPPHVVFVPASSLPLASRVACVTTVHDIGFIYAPELYASLERQVQKKSLMRAVRNAIRIIVPTQYTAEALVSWYPSVAGKLEIIPLGYDENIFFHSKNRHDRDVTLIAREINEPYFVALGRIEVKKNISGLITSFEQLIKQGYDAWLLLIGKPGYGYERIVSQIGQSPARGRIKIFGWMETFEVSRILQGARALVLPSWYEGFGLPVIEAFACGTPVIASSAGSLPEVVGDAGLLAAPDDHNEWAAAMYQLLFHEPLYRDLQKKGLERAARFRWETCAARTWQVLERVAQDA